MTLRPLTAPQVLDAYFLDARSRLLDLAAMLDRIDRPADSAASKGDSRLARIRQALGVLAEAGAERTARVQELFSLPYDPNWKRPVPR